VLGYNAFLGLPADPPGDDDDTTGVIEAFFSGADGLTSLLHHYHGQNYFKELPPEEAMTKVMAIKTKLQIANSIDKYEGRGTPHTQINIVQLRLDETQTKLDELIRWIVKNCNSEQVAQLKTFLQAKNIVSEEGKTVDAEYTVINQS
jgi:hypothetical protein